MHLEAHLRLSLFFVHELNGVVDDLDGRRACVLDSIDGAIAIGFTLERVDLSSEVFDNELQSGRVASINLEFRVSVPVPDGCFSIDVSSDVCECLTGRVESFHILVCFGPVVSDPELPIKRTPELEKVSSISDGLYS